MIRSEDVEVIGAGSLSKKEFRLAVGLCLANESKKGLVLDPEISRLRRMRKSVLTSARLIEERLGVKKGREAQWKAAMLTLTYHKVDDWHANHISSLIRHAREFLKRRGFAFHYVWTAELQERGAVHYHIVFWMPRIKSGRWGFLRFPKPDEMGWWPWGTSRIHWARNAVGYLVKYSSKAAEQVGHMKYPKGCRLSGKGGLTSSEKVEVRYWLAPVYAREGLGRNADIRKVRGGYEDKFTGDFAPSPWELVCFLGGFPFFVWRGVDNVS